MCLIGALSQPHTSFAQLSSYQFEQIDSLQKIEKRNIVVFIHTDWCKYCQTMKNTTFKNDFIIKMLNDKFYFIEFDAEDQQNITFINQTFKYKPTGINTGANELAYQLGMVNNKLSFPTLCVLNSDNEIIFQYPEYINANDLKAVLTRFK
jgi:thioredoxin-related protein